MHALPNHFSKFLLTPQIHDYESFRGYVTRVSVRNESVPLVRPALKTLTDASKCIPMLAQLTNTDPEILKSHGALVVEGTENHMMARFGNTHIPSSYLRHTTRHICPRCLAEEGFSMGYWDLQLYSVCHRHGLRLINECSNCKKGFEWHIGRTDICKCGTPLTEMSAKSVPGADGVGLGEVLAAAYMHSLDQNRETSAHSTGNQFLPLDWTLLLIEFIGHVLIPDFFKRIGSEFMMTLPQTWRRMTSTMLLDRRYRMVLRHAIFLHAAKDPLTMRRALMPGNCTADIVRSFAGCTADMPFHECLWEYQHKFQYVLPTPEKKSVKRLRLQLAPRSTRRKVHRTVEAESSASESRPSAGTAAV